jgi:hypothetical protein
MAAVARFVTVFVIAPIHLVTLAIAAAVFGWPVAIRMTVLQALVSLTAFEALFSRWRQLPFVCSYAPGKRTLTASLTTWIVVLGFLVPVLSRIVAGVSQLKEVFLIFSGVFVAASCGRENSGETDGVNRNWSMKIKTPPSLTWESRI